MSDPLIAPARYEAWISPDGRPTERFAQWAERVTTDFNALATDGDAEAGLSVGMQGEIAALKKRICDIEREL